MKEEKRVMWFYSPFFGRKSKEINFLGIPELNETARET
jgi:hypothetical protein